eukprot:TRINITY_DN17167_c0_g1_i2.p1 TRINITY_DN17167_c0_g1~~TRINITY_DN17167_c0_g1_i2.p1  ORF type:complete len:326 (-),score=71.93 TRINITY_DN17167_c0_g1_i2:584-1561(-)
MPSAALDFRHRCGGFLWVYVNFMTKRARFKLAMRVRVLKVRTRLTGVMVGLILTVFFYGDFLLRCGDVETNPGPPKLSNLRQTRLNSDSASRRVSTERSGPDPCTSTPAKELTLQDVMNTLTSKMEEVRHEVHQLHEDYGDLKNELKGLREEVVELRKENQELQKINGDLTEKLGDCEKRIDDLEGRSKRNNLIFYGLPRREKETPADCEGMLQDLFTDKLDMTRDVELDRVHRLSSKPDSPVIACCTFYRQKVTILKQKKKLKGSDVFIGEDFSKGVRDIRRRLAPHLKKARQDGKRATMIFNHLLIDGQKYSVDSRENLVQLK